MTDLRVHPGIVTSMVWWSCKTPGSAVQFNKVVTSANTPTLVGIARSQAVGSPARWGKHAMECVAILPRALVLGATVGPDHAMW